MNDVVVAKVQQARELLREFDVPLWIVQFARESHDNRQPVSDLAVGTSVTWPGVFAISASGETTAIVGSGDVENVKEVGAYEQVIGYIQDVGPPLLEFVRRTNPDRIALSYSEGDESADNITHGMYLMLQRLLADTGYAQRLESADRILMPLRSRKVDEEIRRIRDSVAVTLGIFDEIEGMLEIGMSERDVQQRVWRIIDSQALECSWDRRYDPIVNFGPESAYGHLPPGSIRLERGMLVHVDLGVKKRGYCSDLQRTWYVAGSGEDGPPDEVRRAFSAVRRSLEAGFSELRPGVHGHEVDAAARGVLAEAGYDLPPFALGHQLGQSAHDAGALLGPLWPRYGDRPNLMVEAGNVFTLEFAVRTSAGVIGLEEDVLVTPKGAEYLGEPQTELLSLER